MFGEGAAAPPLVPPRELGRVGTGGGFSSARSASIRTVITHQPASIRFNNEASKDGYMEASSFDFLRTGLVLITFFAVAYIFCRP